MADPAHTDDLENLHQRAQIHFVYEFNESSETTQRSLPSSHRQAGESLETFHGTLEQLLETVGRIIRPMIQNTDYVVVPSTCLVDNEIRTRSTTHGVREWKLVTLFVSSHAKEYTRSTETRSLLDMVTSMSESFNGQPKTPHFHTIMLATAALIEPRFAKRVRNLAPKMTFEEDRTLCSSA